VAASSQAADSGSVAGYRQAEPGKRRGCGAAALQQRPLRGRDAKSLVRKFSAALVAPLATTFVAVLAEWLWQRGDSVRAKRDTDHALSRINFLSAWLGLLRQLPESEAESTRIVKPRSGGHTAAS
jgi:hypothetical protein